MINIWMDPSRPVDTVRAMAQWTALADTYRALRHTVELIDPEPGLPDMVFAANAGTVIDGVVLGARFRDAVIASAADAACLGLNGVSDGRSVVLPAEAVGLGCALAARGFEPVFVDVSELRRAGGGPKCCTLELRS